MPTAKKARFRSLFGKLVLRYTRTRCYATLGDYKEVSRYVVVAKNATSVVICMPSDLTGDQDISHIHFVGRHYWITLGPIREYFRKIA